VVIASKDASALIVGRQEHCICNRRCLLREWRDVRANRVTSAHLWKRTKPDELEVRIQLQDASAAAGAWSRKVRAERTGRIPLHTYAEAGRLITSACMPAIARNAARTRRMK